MKHVAAERCVYMMVWRRGTRTYSDMRCYCRKREVRSFVACPDYKSPEKELSGDAAAVEGRRTAAMAVRRRTAAIQAQLNQIKPFATAPVSEPLGYLSQWTAPTEGLLWAESCPAIAVTPDDDGRPPRPARAGRGRAARLGLALATKGRRPRTVAREAGGRRRGMWHGRRL